MKNTSLYPEQEYKFVILGNTGNGKTSYLIRLEKNQFSTDTAVTVGVDYTNLTKKFQYDNRYHKANVWDTSGQEIYRAIAGNYIKKSIGAFIAVTLEKYDKSDFQQFKKQTKQQLKSWIKFISEIVKIKNYAYHIIGTKLDFVSLQRRQSLQSVFREIIKQVLTQLKMEKVPIQIESSLFDYSVISAKLQVTTKQEIQKVLFKLIKTKYIADKNSGGRQQEPQGVKLELDNHKPVGNSRIRTRDKCC